MFFCGEKERFVNNEKNSNTFRSKPASDQPFNCSMDFCKNARKVVIPIRKVISILNLSQDKQFDQIDSMLSELISLIDLITENNSSSRNGSQSTLTTARLII